MLKLWIKGNSQEVFLSFWQGAQKESECFLGYLSTPVIVFFPSQFSQWPSGHTEDSLVNLQ